ncbi:LOW QUALITY PROTEIN: hypothetical protein TorRG33x02_033570 [Trema orientale]|uniref:Uncharacterized protein n=1 Tax=Trema orientale TaxID=63057 RepID=A0A2P5FSE6_TREOI|nr:LOW QUALITY PROTEIN: hypothetical protein TorRG33x02_033570 [Trema orientale]
MSCSSSLTATTAATTKSQALRLFPHSLSLSLSLSLSFESAPPPPPPPPTTFSIYPHNFLQNPNPINYLYFDPFTFFLSF